MFKNLFKNGAELGKKKAEDSGKRAEIYFAGGCFWGIQKYLNAVPGVVSTDVGYANGNSGTPTYEEVCTGDSGFAEAVHVIYDPARAPLFFLLEMFYKAIDPISVNRQGNDVGEQYRTGIYYLEDREDEDGDVIRASLLHLADRCGQPPAIETGFLRNYYTAEEYHQSYLDKNPNGYCHINQQIFDLAGTETPESVLAEFYERLGDEELKRVLRPEQYVVTQKNATEPPFQNEYWDQYQKGIYVDVTTGEPLFSSTDKFESACGWPSFAKPIGSAYIKERRDGSLGLQRTEVRSGFGNAHLGHVFDDGPLELGGLRYCINSASLRFVPADEMAEEGYGWLLPLVEEEL